MTGWVLMGIECVSAQSHSLISTKCPEKDSKINSLKAPGIWRRHHEQIKDKETHRNYFFKCHFLKIPVFVLSFFLSVFMYSHWFYPSLSSVSFDSWCFLEEPKPQECWLRGLRLKERFCSLYCGKRQAQCLFSRKGSMWDREKKRGKWLSAHIVEVHNFKIIWSHS